MKKFHLALIILLFSGQMLFSGQFKANFSAGSANSSGNQEFNSGHITSFKLGLDYEEEITGKTNYSAGAYFLRDGFSYYEGAIFDSNHDPDYSIYGSISFSKLHFPLTIDHYISRNESYGFFLSTGLFINAYLSGNRKENARTIVYGEDKRGVVELFSKSISFNKSVSAGYMLGGGVDFSFFKATIFYSNEVYGEYETSNIGVNVGFRFFN